jgi:integrase
MAKRLPEGISVRHARSCPSRSGGRCRCTPRYQAQAWSPRDRKRLTRTFPTLAAARGWRYDALVGLRHGTLRAAGGVTLRQAADEWLAAAEAGLVRNRSGDPYKPSALRGYEQSLRARILPALGGVKLGDIRRSDVQRLVNRMMADGLGPSTVRNSLMPLRAIYRQALALDEVAVNPTAGVQLPAVRGKRERIASPAEAAQLIAALPQRDRAVWATAMYAGLRSGELQALTDELVDLDSNVIRVQWSWDPKEGRVAPKSRSGRRTVPVPAALRKHLLEHRLARGRRGGLFFGRPDGRPFSNQSLSQRAIRHWRKTGLQPIGLHECRHTFASLMIAAGVNAKALSTFLGHASVTITLDRYGHLFPGSEQEAAGLLDSYLERSVGGGPA